MPLILGANSLTGGYDVDNSLRFDSGSSDYLSRTPATSGNGQIWTYSAWIKRSNITDTYGTIFNAYNTAGSADTAICVFYLLNNELVISGATGSAGSYPMLLRDVSAWYHIVVAFDTTQASLANRIKAYINGVQISLNNTTYPALDLVTPVNQNDEHTIGNRRWDAPTVDRYYSGYMSDVYLIDGQQLTPTDFGEFDADSGVWKPIAYEGTFGTNGFFLSFQDSGSLGTDSSGNSNDFTVNNLTSIDQTTDTPTNNFATLNPLVKSGSPTYANGNTQIATIGDNNSVVSSIGTDTMKFYFEVKLSSTYDGSGGGIDVGGLREEQFNASGFNSGTWSGFNNAYTKFYGNGNDGRFKEGGGTVVTSGLTRAVANDIVMIAIDPANNRVYAGVNGTWLNSSDPVAGTGYIGGTAATGTGNWFGYHSSDLDKGDCFVNYGNPAYTISSGNSDANGYGNFEYAVPAGYYALNTKNLAEYG
jgi:hypothetical protein